MTPRQKTILNAIVNELLMSKKENCSYVDRRPYWNGDKKELREFRYCLDGNFDLEDIAIAVDNQLKLADAMPKEGA